MENVIRRFHPEAKFSLLEQEPVGGFTTIDPPGSVATGTSAINPAGAITG
jgi:hypothetical protein